MNAFKYVVFFVLVSCAYALSDDAAEALSVADRMRCGVLRVRSTSSTIGCLRGRNGNRPGRTSTITSTITLSGIRQVATIKTPCNRPTADRRIVPRIIRCVRLLLPRCRCLAEDRRAFCIGEQVVICGGRNDIRFLVPVPTPEVSA